MSTFLTPQILIVEDQSDVARQLSNCLNEAGYESATASNFEEACEAAVSGKADLVLINSDTPERDGASVLRALHSFNPDLPVIIISRGGSTEDVRTAMVNGAFEFYTCPFDNRELLASIADALADRWALPARREVSCV